MTSAPILRQQSLVLWRTLSASTAIHGRLSAVAARMSRRHPSTLSAPRICRRREWSHRQCDPRAQASPRVLSSRTPNSLAAAETCLPRCVRQQNEHGAPLRRHPQDRELPAAIL